MGDTMLHGVLCMPPELWSGTEIDKSQRYSRYLEASRRIEDQDRELAKLRAQLSRYRDEVEKRREKISERVCGVPGCNKPRCAEYKWLSDLMAETPEQSLAAINAQSVREGLELAAKLLEKEATDYDEAHGYTEPDTGARVYPGDGAEYVYSLEDFADQIRLISADKLEKESKQ